MIIRFPVTAKWDRPMATRTNVLKRLWWKLFGHRRKANMAKIRLDRVRRYG
jgi:hypothetical protein